MARLVLHMGTHKTATTTIQDCFRANRRLLAGQGLIYPALGRHSGHHGLASDWIALPPAYRLPKGGIGTLRALAEAHRDGDGTLFLSSEEFSRGGGAGGRVDMAALREIFRDFEVVALCVLRSQWQFLQSVYLELARSRCPDRPPRLAAQAIETGMVDGLWCDYGALYEHLRTGFAPEEIHLLDYETARSSDDGIIGEILSLAGVRLDLSALRQVNGGRSNVSPRALPVWAALAICGQPPIPATLLDALGTAFDLEFGAGRSYCLFTRAEVAALDAWFGPRNAALAERVANVQPGFSLAAPRPAPAGLYREDVTGAFWLRAARRIFLNFQAEGV